MDKEAQSKLRAIGNQPLRGRLESQQYKCCNFGLSELGAFAALLLFFVHFGSHQLHAKNSDAQSSFVFSNPILALYDIVYLPIVYLFIFCLFCPTNLGRILTVFRSRCYPIGACSQQACKFSLQYKNKGVYHHEVSNQNSSCYQSFHNLRCHNVNIKLSAATSSAACVLIML